MLKQWCANPQVFDVTKGAQHYGAGPDGKRSGYNIFAGMDNSRAFVSGEFDRSKVTPSFFFPRRRTPCSPCLHTPSPLVLRSHPCACVDFAL